MTAPETAWAAAFSNPTLVVNAVNDQGFGNSAYRPASMPPPNFISTGSLPELTAGAEGMPNNAGVYIYGNSESQIDEIRFKLNLNSPTYAQTARTFFTAKLNAVLYNMKVPRSDDMADIVANEVPGTTKLDGAELTIRRLPVSAAVGDEHSVLFIFHRPGVKPE